MTFLHILRKVLAKTYEIPNATVFRCSRGNFQYPQLDIGTTALLVLDLQFVLSFCFLLKLVLQILYSHFQFFCVLIHKQPHFVGKWPLTTQRESCKKSSYCSDPPRLSSSLLLRFLAEMQNFAVLTFAMHESNKRTKTKMYHLPRYPTLHGCTLKILK